MALALLAGAGCRRDGREPFLTYYNPDHAVTLRYPASWKTEQAQQEGAWYRYFLAPPTGADRRAAVSVTLIAASVEGTTLDAYAQTYLAGNTITTARDETRPGAAGRYWLFASPDGARKFSLLLLEESPRSRAELVRALSAARASRPSPAPAPSPVESPAASPAASPSAAPAGGEAGPRWVYGLYSQGDRAEFESHGPVLEEMAQSLALERPAHYGEHAQERFHFSLRTPASWKSSRNFAAGGTYLVQYTSPAFAVERGQTIHASLTLTVEPAPEDGSVEAYYEAALERLGDAFSVLSHQPWKDGYVDVTHSETTVAVSRSKRFFRTAEGRGYSLVCEGRDDIYPRFSRWCDIIAVTLQIGSEVGRP